MDVFTSNIRPSLALLEMFDFMDALLDALLDDRMDVQTEALIHSLIHALLNVQGNVRIDFGKHALIGDLIDALINFQTDDLMHTLIEALINFRIEAPISVWFNAWIPAPIHTFTIQLKALKSLRMFYQQLQNTFHLFSSAVTTDPGLKQCVDKGRWSELLQKDQATTTPPPDVWSSASTWGQDYNKDQGEDYNKDQGEDYNKDQGQDYNKDQGEDYNKDQGQDYNKDQGEGCNKDQGQDQGNGWRTHGPHGDLCAIAALLFLGCQ
ncbi:uncharacterized protein LOC129823893 [Salvelinus fontinalis]|uniref:uncharacterized protein LOC129823893 n=1 Tax=Salvelinus fontinalis TaxID=8038 RepID=UPI002486964E|nr:uncharacterized protein LOC129823893 [Salvelinus fontinalis]